MNPYRRLKKTKDTHRGARWVCEIREESRARFVGRPALTPAAAIHQPRTARPPTGVEDF